MLALVTDPFLESYGPDAWSIYVHVPFCEQKCAYCDFFTITDPERTHPLQSSWLQLCLQELDMWLIQFPELRNRPVGSLSLGGGTPSLLRPEWIRDFLVAIKQRLAFNSQAEIGLEIQPGTLVETDYLRLADAGITRFSVGVQTLQTEVLRQTGRIHTDEDSFEALQGALKSGATVGADLIANLPGESLSEFLGGLQSVAKMSVHHISTYELTWHEGTEWERQSRVGQLVPSSEEVRLEWQTAMERRLSALGYQRYEVSNACRPGFPSRHNCSYWEGADYLGLGAGAHGFMRPQRWFNPPQAKAWARAIMDGKLYARESNSSSSQVTLVENLHMALRKLSGANRNLFCQRFGHDPILLAPEAWEALRTDGLAQWNDHRVWLTPEGLLRLDGLTEFLVTQLPAGLDSK